jgi:hypothetical protein
MKNYLVIINYYNGTQTKFKVIATKILSADWIVRNKYKHLIENAESMSVESI